MKNANATSDLPRYNATTTFNKVQKQVFFSDAQKQCVQTRGGHGSGVDSGRILRFLPDPDPDLESKILKNRTRIRGHLSISAVAGVCVVISEVSPLVIFGCIDCSRSLNRRRILKFKKFQDTDTDLKVLEQEQSRSLKK